MPSFKIIGLLVLEKIFKGSCYLWPWQPSWSCDLDHLYKLLFPFSNDAQHEKVQVGKDQEKAQSEKDSHSKN